MREMDGFECDVRLSHDHVPVVVHDASLERTHGVHRRVSSMTAEELGRLGVPTLRDALALLQSTRNAAILDLKCSEQTLIPATVRIAKQLHLDMRTITFLVWNRIPEKPKTRATILRAVDRVFHVVHPFVDGVACKYDGSEANRRCIDRALEAGLTVNLWSPTFARDMIDRYGSCCSVTVGI